MAVRAQPFGALIAASSLVVAVLYVAGFAYRWSYYYNFGVQHIVYELGVQVIVMTAIELVRTWDHLLLLALGVAVPLVLVNLLLAGLRRLRRSARAGTGLTSALGALGLDSSLVVDALRALVLIYATYMVSSQLGYWTYTRHIVDSPDNPLPRVTVVLGDQEGGPARPLACGAEGRDTPVVGDARTLREIQETFRTCTGRGIVWRLLYRGGGTLVLFASEPAARIRGRRPLTVVIPASDATSLVLQ